MKESWKKPLKKYPEENEFPILILIEVQNNKTKKWTNEIYLISHIDEEGDMVDEYGDTFSIWDWNDVCYYLPIPKKFLSPKTKSLKQETNNEKK